MKANKIDITPVSEKWNEFIDNVIRASKLSKNMAIKKEDDKLLLYTVDGTIAKTNAMIYYLLDWDDYFSPIDKSFFLPIEDGTSFAKSLEFYYDDPNTKLELDFRENEIISAKLKSKKLKVVIKKGEEFVIRNITSQMITQINNKSYSLFNFQLTAEGLSDINKLIKLHKGEEIISCRIDKNKIVFHQGNRWYYNLADIDDCPSDFKNFAFPKEYFKLIGSKEITVYCYPNFIMFSDLMVGVDKTFE